MARTKKAERVMKSHTFREYDEEWAAAIAAATFFNEDVSEVIRRSLAEYVAKAAEAQSREDIPA